MFGMTEKEKKALVSIAKLRAKHGKGSIYNLDDVESMDPFTGKMGYDTIYEGKKPGSKKVIIGGGYGFGKRRRRKGAY